MPSPHHWITHFINEESLPASYAAMVQNHFLPLATRIATWSRCAGKPIVVGINGGQGTGKSTLSRILTLALQHEYGLKSAILSIDDIYLTRAERQIQAEDVHPLLMTRGVPGTHDVDLGCQLLSQLKLKKPCQLPSFDKAYDDRAPESEWTSIAHPVDIILFEGWCIGAKPQDEDALANPINRLEECDDYDMAWRSFVNDTLSSEYQTLFSHIDRLVMLKAPDFQCIQDWRTEQERKLKQQLVRQNALDSKGIQLMSPHEISRFIMYYERLTRWMIQEMPERADCVIELTPDHQISQVRWPHPPTENDAS